MLIKLGLLDPENQIQLRLVFISVRFRRTSFFLWCIGHDEVLKQRKNECALQTMSHFRDRNRKLLFDEPEIGFRCRKINFSTRQPIDLHTSFRVILLERFSNAVRQSTELGEAIGICHGSISFLKFPFQVGNILPLAERCSYYEIHEDSDCRIAPLTGIVSGVAYSRYEQESRQVAEVTHRDIRETKKLTVVP